MWSAAASDRAALTIVHDGRSAAQLISSPCAHVMYMGMVVGQWSMTDGGKVDLVKPEPRATGRPHRVALGSNPDPVISSVSSNDFAMVGSRASAGTGGEKTRLSPPDRQLTATRPALH